MSDSLASPVAAPDERRLPLPDDQLRYPVRVGDLKQWHYCPRVVYFDLCLPHLRPTTYLMQVGHRAGMQAARREMRRSLRRYGLEGGERAFNVHLASERLGLHGVADLVIYLPSEAVALPVDYKNSRRLQPHVRLQIAAYALLLEETLGQHAPRGFVYLIPLRRAVEVRITPQLRRAVLRTLEQIQTMLWQDRLPEPTPHRARCVDCEFRRFCNDTL